MSSPFRIVEHVVPTQHIREYPGATANDQEEPLHLAVKQYIPLDNPNPQPGDITILAAHANGFPKVWDQSTEVQSRQTRFRSCAHCEWRSKHRISNILIVSRRNYTNRFGRKSTLDLSRMGCAFAVSGWPTWRTKAKAAWSMKIPSEMIVCNMNVL